MKIMKVKQADGTIANIPIGVVTTKVSQLENDMGYITVDDIPESSSVTKVSELENDAGYITANDIPITSTDYSVTINGKEFLDFNSDDSMHLSTHNSLNLFSTNGIYLNAKNIDVEGDMTVQTPKTAESVVNKKYVDDSVANLDIPSKVSELTNDSGYQTAANVNTLISNAAISTSQLTNGNSVDKLYLDGKFHIGSASSNKTFRLPADAITIEYSNDGGSTWTNYGNTAAQKEMLFDESQGYTWYLGKKTDKTQTTNDMLRVTISNVTDRYIGVKQVYHYASYNGQGLVFDLEYSTLSAPTTFVKVISDGRLRGWYGHNMYNFNQRTIGASNATTSAIRLTYKMNEINNSYASSSIKDIRFFGDNVWTAPADSYIGNMLKLNTPYKFTDDNTIDFPGTVDVNALKVNGTDISETYATKADATSELNEITSQISQLSSEKLDKNQGSANAGKILVVGTDGNLVLADMPEGGGDVTGVLDEENNILLSGNLADGTYTLKYENADGTYSDVGTLVVVATKPSYTNLADPTSADWQEGYRLSISSGSTSALDGHTVTNYIPAKTGDVLRVKGLIIHNSSDSNGVSSDPKFVLYKTDKTKLGGSYGTSGINSSQSYGTQVSVNGDISTYTVAFLNDGQNLATSNCAYIRFDGFLMDGYTSEDVIITVNEEITE